ncbi:MAG: calcium-binding protein, partial [Hyphomicrobium sp.]
FGVDTVGILRDTASRAIFTDRLLTDFVLDFAATGSASFPYAGRLSLQAIGSSDRLILSSAGLTSTSNVANDDNISKLGIDVFEFADGETISGADMFRIAWAESKSPVPRYATDGADVFDGANTGERLYLLTGNDLSDAGSGDDTVYAGHGDDLVLGGAGIDVLFGEAGADTLHGGLDNDFLLGNAGNDILRGEDGRDFLFGGQGDDQAFGGIAGDVIHGGGGDDRLYGEAGADQLRGGAGNDILVGGLGNDTLKAGSGNDTIVFDRGDGLDWIEVSTDRAAGDTLTISFGPEITADIVRFSFAPIDWFDAAFVQQDRNTPFVTNQPEKTAGPTLEIGFANGFGDRIGISSFFGQGQIDRLVFADGTELTTRDVLEQAMSATAGDDTTKPVDYLGYGLQFLEYGGRGNDTMSGTSETDTFIFGKGDGRDIALAANSEDEVYIWNANPSDVVLTRIGAQNSGLSISFKDTPDTLTIPNHYTSGGALKQIRFADGTVWTVQQINDRVLSSQATNGNDSIADPDVSFVSPGSDNTVAGGKGDDTISGGYGNDTYVYAPGDGIDTITDRAVNSFYNSSNTDILRFAAGIRPRDVIVQRVAGSPDDVDLVMPDGGRVRLIGELKSTGEGVERVQFADGTVWTRGALSTFAIEGQGTAADDAVTGTAAGETLNGRAGNDVLIGAAGSDTYIYNRGDGDDTLSDIGTGIDTLVLGPGINREDLSFARSLAVPQDLVITIAGGGSIVVKGQFSTSTTTGLETVALADGTRIDRNGMASATIAGQQSDGNDVVTGSDGGDIIYTGKGNDTLSGGKGADSYVFALGDGQDVIRDNGGVAGQDTLWFASPIAPAMVDLYRGGTGNVDLIAAIRGTPDTVTIANFYGTNGAVVGKIAFADGTVWNAAVIAATAANVAPTVAQPLDSQLAEQGSLFTFAVPAGTFSDATAGDT